MNRAFLVGLGLEQEVIKQIMDENGKDIEIAKGKKAELDSQIADLQGQIKERDTQLETLKKSTGDVETLKNQITELQANNQKAVDEANAKYKELQLNTALEKALSEAGVKSVKAVKAFLDLDKAEIDENGTVKGLSEQLETLKTGEETSFLFKEATNDPKAGTQTTPKLDVKGIVVDNGLGTPPGGEDSYQAKWRQAIAKNDTALAIAIKGEAAKDGVFF